MYIVATAHLKALAKEPKDVKIDCSRISSTLPFEKMPESSADYMGCRSYTGEDITVSNTLVVLSGDINLDPELGDANKPRSNDIPISKIEDLSIGDGGKIFYWGPPWGKGPFPQVEFRAKLGLCDMDLSGYASGNISLLLKSGNNPDWQAAANFMVEKLSAAAKEIEGKIAAECGAKNVIDASKTQNIGETKKLQTPPDELKQFLGEVEETQRKIDQCPPPQVPSENACVKDALSQFELPTYIKDITIEPDFTNAIVLDSSKMQVVSFPDGIKSVPDYMLNTISTNLDYLKEEITVDDSQLPIINLLPANPTKVNMPDQSFSIVKSDGLSSVLVPDVTKPVLNYPGNWESVSNLVTLDSDEVSRNVANMPGATKMFLDSSAKVTLLDQSNQSVMEVSNGARIVVAGFAAEDTLEAARDFIYSLSNLNNK